ncbi:MAG: hypothetical protein Q9M13_04115, partial [Mariprofundales bacterium]|nr:hypothetical protein [Mariprofundales bacterium]
MMNAQVTTAASGSPAESGVSGVLKEQGKQGGLFAILMQAFQSHLKAGLAGAEGGVKAQGVQGKGALVTLLQGEHGRELSALLTKLAKGDLASDASMLDGLSVQALAALKLALSQNSRLTSADGSVDLAAQIKTALDALATDEAQSGMQSPSADRAKDEDGSSLQMALVAAGVQVAQGKLTTGGLKQQQQAGSAGVAEDLLTKSAKGRVALGMVSGGAGKQAAAGRAVDAADAGKQTAVGATVKGADSAAAAAISKLTTTAQATADQASIGRATTGQATADQATIGQTTARQATADQATIGQTTARQATT